MDAPSRCVKGPARVALSPCQGVSLAWPLPQDKEGWHLGACTEPVLAARLSGGASPLECTSQVIGMALTQGAGSGGHHVFREIGLPDPLA